MKSECCSRAHYVNATIKVRSTAHALVAPGTVQSIVPARIRAVTVSVIAYLGTPSMVAKHFHASERKPDIIDYTVIEAGSRGDVD